MARTDGGTVHSLERAYGGGERRPLGGYLFTMGIYSSIVAALTVAARRTGRRPPERIEPFDMVLIGIATHKLSRLLAKESVTSVLRAPFTRYVRATGESEVNEQVRGEGVRHAVGELVSCPFCLAAWVATGFAAGLVFLPRLTRLTAAAASAVATSDFLQLLYDRAKSSSG
jgi:hypothetical protein